MKKNKKAKLWKIIGLMTGGLAIIATPIITTACSSNSSSNNGGSGDSGGSGGGGEDTEKPQATEPTISTSLNLSGGLSIIANGSGTKSSIEHNLSNILNSDKKLIISNYDKLSKNDQNNLSIKTVVNEGDDSKWGNTTFEEYSKGIEQQNVKDWQGFEEQKNPNQILKVNSKKELKEIINQNINKIIKNVDVTLGEELLKTKVASLADAEIGFDNNKNVLIGIDVNDTPSGLHNATTKTNTKYLIKIPEDKINLSFTTKITVTLNSKEFTQNTSIEYITKTNIKEKQLTNKLADINLEEKRAESDDLGLYTIVNNNDILKKMGWLKEEETIEHNADITFDLLKEDVVKKQLELSENDDLLAIRILMDQRDPSQNDYNGEYSIEADVIPLNNQESDTFNFITYKFLNKQEEYSANNKFQLNVPNAYILDTTSNLQPASYGLEKEAETDSQKYRYIDFAFMGTSFEMGGKDESAALLSNDAVLDNDANVNKIAANLSKKNTFNKFIAQIDKQQKTKKIYLFNGVFFSFVSAKKHEAMTAGYRTVITLDVVLKQGFIFKNAFNHNSNNYNVQGKIDNVKFGIDYGTGDRDQKSIFLNNNKKPSEVDEGNA